MTWSHVGRCSYRGVPGFNFNDVGDDVEVDVVAEFFRDLVNGAEIGFDAELLAVDGLRRATLSQVTLFRNLSFL